MLPLNFFSQNGKVGVGTTSPQATLDINGTTNVNNEINLGGTNTSEGSSGTAGNMISANGTANPQWKNFDLPSGYLDGLVLSAAYIKSATQGVTFAGTNSGMTLSVPYDKDTPKPANWKDFPELNQTFKVNKSGNIVNISVQTLAQINSVDTVSLLASYGCGIYIDGALKFVRTGIVTGVSGSYRTLNLNASIPDLSVQSHTFQFACAERNIPTNITLGIGTAVNTVTLSPEMAGTSVTIKVLEPIQ